MLMITTSWILWNIHIVVPKILSQRFVQFSSIFLNVKAVDFRLLRAVAIEHPTDADAAVLDVLTELPSLNRRSLSLVSPAQVLHRTGSPVTVDHKEKGKALMYQQVIKEVEVGSLPEPETAAGEDGNKNDHPSGASHDEPTPMEEVHTLHNAPVTADPLRIHTQNEELISDETGLNFDGKVGLQQSPSCKSFEDTYSK
ncbi:unnamed protein product [Prunus armeniaca]|uniref:Uncharacterized protein n=1 Tax=Prunus armeniaca TaxID=36596 RepID=A0A6J5VUN4_PRUAR|nr:unnamed protein product [Prunus armeniaca]